MTDVTVTRKTPFAYQAAKFSAYAPLAAIILGCITVPVRDKDTTAALFLGGFNALLVVSAFVLAIVALAGMRKHGKRGIIGYAIVGLVLNGLILIAFVGAIQAARSIAAAQRPMTAAALQNAPILDPEAQVIIDATHGFRVEIPPEFSPTPVNAQLSSKTKAFSWQREDGTQWMMTIEPLDGLMVQERQTAGKLEQIQSEFPPGAKVTRATFTWKRFTLDGIEVHLNDELAGYAVQVPAIPQAVQLYVMGNPDDLPALRKLMNEMLKSFKANSNWKPSL